MTTDEICSAIKDLYDETRVIAEPAGALSLAGARKYILSKLFNNKEACQKLFSEISKEQKSRNGGYTRIIKKGNRFGDFAHTSIIQFVK